MDAKKFIVGTLAGGVAAFLLGWIIYGMLLMKFFEANAGSATGVNRGETDMVWWALILGNLGMAALLTYIYGRWAGIKTFTTGAMAGAMIGLLLGVSYDFIMYSTTNLMNMTGTIVDIVVTIVMMALVGGVVGAALGMGKDS